MKKMNYSSRRLSTSLLAVIVLSLWSKGGHCVTDLIENGSFETGTMKGWKCVGAVAGYPSCQVTKLSTSCGHNVLKVSRRTNERDGPVQTITVNKHFMYKATAMVKLLNNNFWQMGQPVYISVIWNRDKTKVYEEIARQNAVQQKHGWIKLETYFVIPYTASQYMTGELRITGPDRHVAYLVDCVSLTNVWRGNGWRDDVDRNIRIHRQSQINIRVQLPSHPYIHRYNVQIQVELVKRSFPLGTAVNTWSYVCCPNSTYNKFIHQHFNWATDEASLKWKRVEPVRGPLHYDKALKMIAQLKTKGIKTRGHTLLWPTAEQLPEWVKRVPAWQLKGVVDKHIAQTVNFTRGKVAHWDVLNENLHYQWIQNKLKDFDYELEPFRIAHRLDPNAKLFLNDYEVVAHGLYTSAYVNQAWRLKRANVGLSGLGAQCHFWKNEAPDPYLIKHRLDMLASTGLPIWITEFNVQIADEKKRADYVETAMRAFFGHPAVKGIVIWGFWDRIHYRGPDASIVEGSRLTPNLAGQRFLNLWEKEWTTKDTRTLAKSGPSYSLRGYHGDYVVRVIYKGKQLYGLTKRFTLRPYTASTVNITFPVNV